MKKIIFTCLLSIFIVPIAKSQTMLVKGIVKDDKTNPLHFVFVLDAQHKEATYTDSLGNFSILVHPDSKLEFGLTGYSAQTITAEGKTDIQILLNGAGNNLSNNQETLSAQVKTSRSSDNEPVTIGTGGLIMPSHQKGEVHGSRYFPNYFVRGFIIMTTNALIQNHNYLFTYEKMNGTLMITKDKKSIEQLSFDDVKSFKLYTNTDECLSFEKVPSIDQLHYFQVLAVGSKYKIYKLVKTKFVRSDFVNNGVTQHGNDYDEYVDDAEYYLQDGSTKTLKKITLKKKALKEAFSNEADKLNSFLSKVSGSIDDAYLSKLGTYMNQ